MAWRSQPGMVRRAGIALIGVAMTSLVASLATAPYALFHFNRFAAYGLVANLVAVPLTGLWVMPWAVAGVHPAAVRARGMGAGADGLGRRGHRRHRPHGGRLGRRGRAVAGDAGLGAGRRSRAAACGYACGRRAGDWPACRSSFSALPRPPWSARLTSSCPATGGWSRCAASMGCCSFRPIGRPS